MTSMSNQIELGLTNQKFNDGDMIMGLPDADEEEYKFGAKA